EMLESGNMSRALSGLYDKFKKEEGKESGQGGQAFDITSELLREGLLPQATSAERKARAGVEELRQGVERAAGSVLGDDSEALRLAQSELDALTEQLQWESAQQQQQQQSQSPQKAEAQGAQKGQKGADGKQGQKALAANAGGGQDGEGASKDG